MDKENYCPITDTMKRLEKKPQKFEIEQLRLMIKSNMNRLTRLEKIAGVPITAQFEEDKINLDEFYAMEYVAPVKEKKTQTFEFWVNCYKDGTTVRFDTEELANLEQDGWRGKGKRLGPAEHIVIERSIDD